MSSFDFDILTIGAGSGGVRASRMAAIYGARVAVCEAGPLGGTCVNLGCIPKKLFVHASHFPEEAHDMQGFGWETSSPRFNWPTLRENKNREILRLNGVYGNLLEKAGVQVLKGRASLDGAGSVRIKGQHFTARNILLATGSCPVRPDIPGGELAITSDEAFHLESFPKRALVVGGGYIGVEFAGIFSGLGAEVDLIYRGEKILRGFDDSLRDFVSAEITKKGTRIRCQTDVSRLEKASSGEIIATLNSGEQISTDLILYAIGRRPNTAGLGLESAGVTLTSAGAVAVDSQFRTGVPSIYAIGDLIDRFQLTPVAIAEGMTVARVMALGEVVSLDYDAIPTAVFCQPNLGSVGLTEAQSRASFDAISIFESEFRPLQHTLSGSSERSYVKLIVDQASDRVLGAHLAGPQAGEIVQGLAVALKAGATKAVFDSTIAVHPTLAEEFVTMREASR